MGPEKFARIKSVILCCRPQPQLPPASLIKQISQMQSLEKLRLTGVLRLIDQPPYNDDYEWYINSLKHVFGNLPFAKAVLQYCNPNKIHIEVELDIITEYMRPYKKVNSLVHLALPQADFTADIHLHPEDRHDQEDDTSRCRRRDGVEISSGCPAAPNHAVAINNLVGSSRGHHERNFRTWTRVSCCHITFVFSSVRVIAHTVQRLHKVAVCAGNYNHVYNQRCTTKRRQLGPVQALHTCLANGV